MLELVGGILLALGLGGRLIALPLTIDMIVAYITADREALTSIFSDPGKFYNAAPFTFLMASLIVLIFGSGTFLAWTRSSSVGGFAMRRGERGRIELPAPVTRAVAAAGPI